MAKRKAESKKIDSGKFSSVRIWHFFLSYILRGVLRNLDRPQIDWLEFSVNIEISGIEIFCLVRIWAFPDSYVIEGGFLKYAAREYAESGRLLLPALYSRCFGGGLGCDHSKMLRQNFPIRDGVPEFLR
jgi:hypothetical protein